MPKSCALVNLEPAFSPATNASVLADTLPATFAPNCCKRALASFRFKVLRVPVNT